MFRITTVCNKNCPTCCCDKKKEVLDPERFRQKLREIAKLFGENADNLKIFLTGGEPFLYKWSENGETWSIASLTNMIRTIIPNSNIIIKTSGWDKHNFLDTELSAIESQSKEGAIEIRLGFNLFQNLGVNAENRLYHMLSALLKFQNVVQIETIYDKTNKDETFNVIGKTLSRLICKDVGNLGQEISNPTFAYFFEFPLLFFPDSTNHSLVEKRVVLLNTMPAHPGFEKTASDLYFKAENTDLCPIIQSEPSHILYNADFSFYHCNDAFVDYSIPPFPPIDHNSIENEFLFLDEKFKVMRTHIDAHDLKFNNKIEQCAFCTKFIHSSMK